MQECGGCGFRNAPDRDTCAKCGLVFREATGGSKAAVAVAISAVLVLAGAAGILYWSFVSSGTGLKREASPPRAARLPEPSPAQPLPEWRPEPPARKQGEEKLREADRRFAEGDYKRALAAYRDAEFLGALTEESLRRKETAAAVEEIRGIRDYLARESQVEPSWVTVGHWNLKKIDPARLPSDAWRDEHRKTLKRLEELVEGTSRPAPRPVEAPKRP